MATREMPNGDELRQKYKSNSKASKHKSSTAAKPDTEQNESSDIPKKEVKQIATAKVRKQGLLRRFGKSIIEDGIESAKEKAYNDIIVPGVKSIVFDTITDMLDTMLFGGSESISRGSQRRSESRRRGDRTSYSEYYEKRSRGNSRGSEREDRYYEPDDIILDTRADARDVLDELDFMIRKYGQASVADYYDLVGVTGDWTDNRYGWMSLRGATIKPIRDGFLIVMPRTHLLDD